ncbi:MAG: YciI family protein, partial [Acidobacteria bacterium]|nr:YciI family protein [Acidobacteriota bacterium]
MKYMLLAYGAEDAWTDEERAQCMAESAELCHELDTEGRFLAASPLQPIRTATTVRVRDGRRVITDGPFAETTEQLGGFYLIEAESLDEALAIASRIPAARVGSIEVRPIEDLDDLPGLRHGRQAGVQLRRLDPRRQRHPAHHRARLRRPGLGGLGAPLRRLGLHRRRR